MQNKKWIFLYFLLIYFFIVPVTYPVDFKAYDLYIDCQKNLDSNNVKITVNEQFQAGFCIGYVKGLDDMLYLHYSMKNEKNKKILLYCMPNGVSLNDMSAVYINYMKHHPELNNEEAGEILIEALMEKYPC